MGEITPSIDFDKRLAGEDLWRLPVSEYQRDVLKSDLQIAWRIIYTLKFNKPGAALLESGLLGPVTVRSK